METLVKTTVLAVRLSGMSGEEKKEKVQKRLIVFDNRVTGGFLKRGDTIRA